MKRKTKKKVAGLPRINMKVNKRDRAALLIRAKRYTKGNISAWLRIAGLKYVPNKKDSALTSKSRYQK